MSLKELSEGCGCMTLMTPLSSISAAPELSDSITSWNKTRLGVRALPYHYSLHDLSKISDL